MSKKPVKFLTYGFTFMMVLIGAPATALTLSEDFGSVARRDSGSLVWNSALGTLHPPLQVYQYFDGSTQSKNFLIGDGSDGAFVPSRYAQFGAVVGTVVQIDTDVHPVLEFTSFELVSGWTIEPVGSQPLIIRTLGAMTISGLINCSGLSGENQNLNPAITVAGGAGRCRGGHGGSGGSSSVPAGTGGVGGPIIIGGAAGGFDGPTGGAGATGTNSGGGGGGAYAEPRGVSFDPSDGSGGTFGAKGLIAPDNDFDNLGGGFGGGGGSYHSGSGTASDNSAGAGGGGGGGLIFLTAGGNIEISGSVLANGGDGGNGASLAGGGGGGGGGSIAMFAGGDVILSGGATVSAAGGAGQGPGGRVGGDGSAGRTWLVGASGYSTGGPPYEFPDPTVTDVGVVRYQTGLFTALSREIDSESTSSWLTTVTPVRTLPGASTLVIEAATDPNSGFTPSWVNVTGVPLALSRYVRFQFSLNSAQVATPAFMDSVTFEISENAVNNFEFVGACGGVAAPPPQTGLMILLYAMILLLPCGVYSTLRFVKK